MASSILLIVQDSDLELMKQSVMCRYDVTTQSLGEMVTITASQVMQVCKFNLAHSYVNVRHKLCKRGLGAPVGGMLSAFYAIRQGPSGPAFRTRTGGTLGTTGHTRSQ